LIAGLVAMNIAAAGTKVPVAVPTLPGGRDEHGSRNVRFHGNLTSRYR